LAPKATALGEMTPNNGHYAVVTGQGIDREFVTSAKKIREFYRIFRNYKNS